MQILEPVLKVGQQLQMCFHLHDFDICIAVLCFRQVSLYVHRRTSGLFRWLKLYAFQSKLIKCQHITPVSNWNHTGLLLISMDSFNSVFNVLISVSMYPIKRIFSIRVINSIQWPCTWTTLLRKITMATIFMIPVDGHDELLCVSTTRTHTRFLWLSMVQSVCRCLL